jgi:hypothetical protein
MTVDYEPLDLSAHANAPVGLIAGTPPTGPLELHGSRPRAEGEE